MTADRGMLEEGDLIGGIEIEKRIGSGGFGVVYRGREPSGALVAVKVLAVEVQHDADLSARLMKEATLMSEIEHDNVVRFHAAGKDGDRIWLAMEYVPGGTLRDQLPRDHPIHLEQALRWARHVAEGCAEVHKIRDITGRPVVHRDLKPENVLLSRDRIAKVADFGIAKFRTSLQSTLSNEGIGTPLYMAPEQMEASTDIDERADVFALGVILYEMLAGRRPAEVGHDRELTLMEKVTRSILQPVVPLPELNPDVPGHVWTIVERALQKKREQRFSSMREMADVLVEALKRVRREHGKKPSFAEIKRPGGMGVEGGAGAVAGAGTVGGGGVSGSADGGVTASAADGLEAAGTVTGSEAGVRRPRVGDTAGAAWTPNTALAAATTDPASHFGAHGTVRIGEPDSSATGEAHVSTLVASSRSLKFPVARGFLSLPVLVGGMVLGVGIGALAFRTWTSSAATVQTAGPAAASAGGEKPLGMLAVPPDAGVVDPPPSPPDAGGAVAQGTDAGVAVAVVALAASVDAGSEKKGHGGRAVVPWQGKKPSGVTGATKPAPKKCAGIACEPDL